MLLNILKLLSLPLQVLEPVFIAPKVNAAVVSILLAAKPTSDQFTHAYSKGLECDVFITNNIGAVIGKSQHYNVLILHQNLQLPYPVLSYLLSSIFLFLSFF